MLGHRDNLTAYDAAYVALAELLAVPLVTADARLGLAPCITCRIDVLHSPAGPSGPAGCHPARAGAQ